MTMFFLRSLSRSSPAHWSRTITPIPTRSFHSPFNVLANASPLTTPPPKATRETTYEQSTYEKQTDHSSQPTVTHSGTRAYVVSEPDPADKHYEIPSGAYPTTAPYQNFEPGSYNGIENKQMSSTSPDLAHPTLTRRAPQNESGVGDSAAVRFAEAPGELGARGGSYGGLGMMDKGGTTKAGTGGVLGERNPGPTDSDAVVEKNSRLGVKDAWKARK